MGKDGPARVETRIRQRALGAALALAACVPAVAWAACPGPGCPAIAFDDLVGGDCPGAGCPAFAARLGDQQAYVELFGALQSGGAEPRPVEGRILLDIPLADDTVWRDAGMDGFLGATCRVLGDLGVQRVEVLGLAAGDRADRADLADRADQRAAAFAETLGATCRDGACGPGGCPAIAWRAAGPTDALPPDVLREGTGILIELRVVP